MVDPADAPETDFGEADFEALKAACKVAHEADEAQRARERRPNVVMRAFCFCGAPHTDGNAACRALRKLHRALTRPEDTDERTQTP